MEYLFIEEKLNENQIVTKPRGKYASIIEKWLRTNNKTLKFMCKNADEKKRVAWSVTSYKNHHNYDYVVYRESFTNNIYLVKP